MSILPGPARTVGLHASVLPYPISSAADQRAPALPGQIPAADDRLQTTLQEPFHLFPRSLDHRFATHDVGLEKKDQLPSFLDGNLAAHKHDEPWDPDGSGRPPCGFEDKPRGPAQESEPATRNRAVIDISFNKKDQSCLVRLRPPYSDPLLESWCKKKLDERASSGQLLSRLEDREPKVTHHEEPSIDGGCESTASTEDTDETELEKYQVSCLGHVKISSCLGRFSKEKERKKNQRKGSVLRSGPNTSDKERHRNFGNCTSWKKLSTRRRGR
ncbi:hypothetical protein HPB47_018708 [Ixodes persulcatus]|uniref:Uncharacterized protein n=1 Tax=Ixodes persulcatus TaxID=34615 RepID=A0AC60QNP2_IXOPE|nr:hypothetical protein HPB47_018708 [Ixodes persulcatus]